MFSVFTHLPFRSSTFLFSVFLCLLFLPFSLLVRWKAHSKWFWLFQYAYTVNVLFYIYMKPWTPGIYLMLNREYKRANTTLLHKLILNEKMEKKLILTYTFIHMYGQKKKTLRRKRKVWNGYALRLWACVRVRTRIYRFGSLFCVCVVKFVFQL